MFSGGRKGGKMISTLDNYAYFPKKGDGRMVEIDRQTQIQTMDRNLGKAARQYRQLVEDWPSFKQKAFLVVAFVDFFVGEENSPEVLNKYPEISALLMVENDRDHRKFIKGIFAETGFNLLKTLQRLRQCPPKRPPLQNTWIILRNPSAANPINARFCTQFFGDFAWWKA